MESRKWRAFYISDSEDGGIFTVRASFSGIDKNKLVSCESPTTPYVTRTDSNNGVSLYVGREQNSKYKIDRGNVITIGLDTQTVFYQSHSFYTGQNIQVLYNKHLNKFVAEFVIPLLKAQVAKLSWGGNGATLGRLKRMKLELPTTESNEPDYNFMEECGRKMMTKKYIQYLNYLESTGAI